MEGGNEKSERGDGDGGGGGTSPTVRSSLEERVALLSSRDILLSSLSLELWSPEDEKKEEEDSDQWKRKINNTKLRHTMQTGIRGRIPQKQLINGHECLPKHTHTHLRNCKTKQCPCRTDTTNPTRYCTVTIVISIALLGVKKQSVIEGKVIFLLFCVQFITPG